MGPAYLIFPLISLSPVITIALSYRAAGRADEIVGAAGIVLALLALPLFDFSPQGFGREQGRRLVRAGADRDGGWGVQAFFMKSPTTA